MKRRTLLAAALASPMAARAETAALLPVLTYHRFDPAHSNSGTIITMKVFEAQMRYLSEQNIAVARLRDVLDVAHGAPLARPTVAITADDGWRTVYTEMFPIIREHRFPVTLFLNPPQIGAGAYLTWKMVAEMQATGLIDMQAHSMTHPNFNIERARRSPDAYAAFVRDELAGCLKPIAEHTGTAPDLLAWPFGIHDAQLGQAARDAGYKAAFALGSRAMQNGDTDFALPRSQIYDTDDTQRFAWMVSGHARQSLKKATT